MLWKGRTDMNDIYVVGDVHGDFKKLIEALVASNWDEKTDKLIFVGDVVDRGIENAKVVNFIASFSATMNTSTGKCYGTTNHSRNLLQ